MSKKMLKRSLALGALMAFVITGSAMAAETTIQPGTYNVIYNSNGQLACPAIWGDSLPEFYTMYGNYMGNDEAYSVVNIGDGVEILSATSAVMNVTGGTNHSTVNMTGGIVVGDIYGGLNGEGNTVNISGGKVSYTSYVNGDGKTVELGGHIHVTNGGEGTAGGNINISGTADLTDATLYGVKPYYSNGTINFMDGWTGTVRAVDTTDVVNITDGANVTIGNIKSEQTKINLDNATWTIADETNVIAELTGENGVIKVDKSVLDTAGAVQIGANESTGTVLKAGVTVDLSGGAKAALEGALETALKDGIKDKLDAAVVATDGNGNFEYAVYAQDAALYGDVDVVDGKVVTEMDTDILVARNDVKAGGVSLKDTAAQVAANKADIATNASAIQDMQATLNNVYTKDEADEKFLTQEDADGRYVRISTSTDESGTTTTEISETIVVEDTKDASGKTTSTKVTINEGKGAQLVVGGGAQNDKIIFGQHSSWYTDGEGFFAGGNLAHDDNSAHAAMLEDGTIKGASGKFEVNGTDGSVKAADGKFEVDADGNVKAVSYNGYNIDELVSQAGNNADAIAGLNQRLDRTNTKINKVGAGAAALAALHPLEYDPDDKLTFSVGMGNYAGENAAALGAFYRPDEKFMISVGGSMGNGENMVNLGLSIGLDKPNGLAKLSKKELIQKVNAVEAENDALEDRVAKLEALVAQLASK